MHKPKQTQYSLSLYSITAGCSACMYKNNNQSLITTPHNEGLLLRPAQSGNLQWIALRSCVSAAERLNGSFNVPQASYINITYSLWSTNISFRSSYYLHLFFKGSFLNTINGYYRRIVSLTSTFLVKILNYS